MNFELISKNFYLVFKGLDETILLVLLSLSIGFIITIFFALARLSSIKTLSNICLLYTSPSPRD